MTPYDYRAEPTYPRGYEPHIIDVELPNPEGQGQPVEPSGPGAIRKFRKQGTALQPIPDISLPTRFQGDSER